MKKIIFYVVALLTFTGCVNTKNIRIEQDAAEQLSGKSIVSTLSDKPDFFATTVNFGGLLGALVARDQGNRLVRENDISDPAGDMGKKLIKDLSDKYSLSVLSVGDIQESDDILDLTKQYENADYILDVRTVGWGFSYFPTDWNNYWVVYRAKMRLIDVKSKELVAEGYCSTPMEETPQSPSYEELVSNGAVGIKEELQKAANDCLSQFKANLL